MTERELTAEPATPQARRYTVGYCPNSGRPNPLPQLTLKGRWLGELGFNAGQPVTITAQDGVLIIRAEMACGRGKIKAPRH